MTVGDRGVIDQLDDAWLGLVALARDLGPDEWDVATECPGWVVRDQYAHVIGTESMLLGRPAPPPAPDAAHVRNEIGRWNEAWVAARRSRPGAALVGELEEVVAARRAQLRSMDDEALDQLGPSPIGRVPYRTFMSVRVMDCWVHEQDVRQVTGRPWRLDGRAASVAVDRLGGSFAYVVGKLVAPPEGTVATLSVEGGLDRRLSVTMRAGRAVPVQDASPATVTVHFDPPTYVRVATGRLAPAEALGLPTCRIEGDISLGTAIVNNLAQMP